MVWNHFHHNDTLREVPRGLSIAIYFGSCSPMIIWSIVITINARGIERECIRVVSIPIPKRLRKLVINWVKVLSQIQPRPRDARVIPICAADKYLSRLLWICWTRRACLLHCFTFTSICEARIFTIANSAATKNPLRKIRKAVINNQVIINNKVYKKLKWEILIVRKKEYKKYSIWRLSYR